MAQAREVVITGVGVVCPIGIGKQPFWNALDAGQSGIVVLPEVADDDFPFRLGGKIQGFDGKDFVQPRKTLKVMCNEIQTAYAAGMLAMEDAGLAKGQVEGERLGVVLGSEMFYGAVQEMEDVYRHSIVEGQFDPDLFGPAAMRDLFPLWMLKYLPNMAACHMGIAFEARGPNNTIVQGGVSSLAAVMEGASYIERGIADVMVVGGVGSGITISALPFKAYSHFTQWKGDPTLAIKPFDRDRTGAVPGEGAGMLVLEARTYAAGRGANILARIRSSSSRFEPSSPSHPQQGTAIRGSIQAALAKAGLQPEDIGHVNAHGVSTVEHDRIEAQAIHATLGDVPVTAPKSYFGDLGAGSGAVEMIASVLALQQGRVPRTLNYKQPDPECPIHVVNGTSLELDHTAAILLNQSDTGQAAAVVIDKP
jgi:3-oxoacyl-[acyl-carrier-protein] synthase II